MSTQQLPIWQRANEVFRSTAGTLSAYRPLQSLSADQAPLHPSHCRILPYWAGRTSDLRCTILQPSNQTCSRRGWRCAETTRTTIAPHSSRSPPSLFSPSYSSPRSWPRAPFQRLSITAAGCAATSRADDHRRAAETRVWKRVRCQTTGISPALMRRSSSRVSASSRRIPSRSKRSMDSTRAIRALPKSPRRKCNCDRIRLLSAM